MAIYHCNIKHGSRKDGRLGVDKFDYINRLGRFAKRHDGKLGYAESGNLPAWASAYPRSFWLAADAGERANGNIYHELEFAVPRELTKEQQIEAAREFVRIVCGESHPYSLGFHDKQGNPHIHLMWTGRMIDSVKHVPDPENFFRRPEKGGCRKLDIFTDGWLEDRRRDWQDVANRHLAAAGHDARIDHRSNKARGIDAAPGVHLGRKAHRLEQSGKSTWRGIKNREAQHLNASLQEVHSQIHQKENRNGKRPGRSGAHHSQQHRAGAVAPKRAFSAWNNRGADRSGLRASGHLGPQRMPALRHSRAGDGQQEPRDAVLQRPVSGHRDGNHRLHGIPGGGLYTVEALNRRQIYKARLLQESYQHEIQAALAARLAYVDRRQPDRIAITLKGGGRVTDHGDRLLTKSGHDQEILAAVALATAKGWKTIHLTGSADFKARAWLQAARAGLQVTGYEPSPDLRAQLAKEKTMLGTPGGTSLTPDAVPDSQANTVRWADALRLAKNRLEAARQSVSALSLFEYDQQRKKVAAWLDEIERRGVNDDLLWQIGHHQGGDGKKASDAAKAALEPLYQLRQSEIDGRKHAAELARQKQIQDELAAQAKADELHDLMIQPGLSAAQMEALQEEHRFYTALAAGYDEAEAKERAAKKDDAPRLH
ncbi:MAG: MobA/MobL family protein [Rhodocyclaceae bacterium]